MRFSLFTEGQMNHYIHTAMELGISFFDHADIYGDGKSEEIFGMALHNDESLKREDMILQSVDGILKRLKTDYLDILLLHRPDALVEPEEVAEAFDILETKLGHHSKCQNGKAVF